MVGDRLRFDHHVARELARERVLARSTSVEWVSALIGLKLRLPQSLSQISERMSSSTGDLRPAATKTSEIARDALARAAVELAEREAVAFDVLDDAGRDHRGRRVDDAAEDARGIDGLRDGARRIGGLDREAFVFAAVTLEIPPRDAVLHRDQHGVRVQERAAARAAIGVDLMRFDGEDDEVLLAGLVEVGGRLHAFAADFRAVVRDQPQAVFADRGEMDAARDDGDFVARRGQA